MNGEQDFTNVDFVIGAVLAQLEELEYNQKISVLASVLAEVCEQQQYCDHNGDYDSYCEKCGLAS